MNASQPPTRRVLVVCLGNHCRSPLGAAALVRHGPPGLEVRSAGLADKHVGSPVHPDMTTAAAALGYDLTGHRGVQVTEQLMEWADLVLAMDAAVLDALRQITPGRDRPELRLYLEGHDVPDPWSHDHAAFTSCAHMIDAAAREYRFRTTNA